MISIDPKEIPVSKLHRYLLGSIADSNNSKDIAIDTNSTMATIAEASIVTNTSSTNSVVCVTDTAYSCD